VVFLTILSVGIFVGVAQASEWGTPDERTQSSNTLFILIGAAMHLAMHGRFSFLETFRVNGRIND